MPVLRSVLLVVTASAVGRLKPLLQTQQNIRGEACGLKPVLRSALLVVTALAVGRLKPLLQTQQNIRDEACGLKPVLHSALLVVSALADFLTAVELYLIIADIDVSAHAHMRRVLQTGI